MRVEDLNISQIALMHAITFICEDFALLRCYAAYVDGCLPTFRGQPYPSHLQGPSSPGRIVPKRRRTLTNIRCVTLQKSEGLNYTIAKA